MEEHAASRDLAAFRLQVEELHERLGGGALEDAQTQQLVRQIVATDARLQDAVGTALSEQRKRKRDEDVASRAAGKQAALLRLAKDMHAVDETLGGLIERSRRALDRADSASAAAERRVPAATIVEYAQRVSYSNAAPAGPAAFEGAQARGWFQGWGTPTPLQHMLAQSRFAAAPDGAAASATAIASSSAAASAAPAAAPPPPPAAAQSAASAPKSTPAPVEPPPPSAAPAFRASRAPAAAAPAAAASVSLDLGGSDDDSDFDPFE